MCRYEWPPGAPFHISTFAWFSSPLGEPYLLDRARQAISPYVFMLSYANQLFGVTREVATTYLPLCKPVL